MTGARPDPPPGHDVTEAARTRPRARHDRLVVPAMLALLLWPAVWNGFPLIFPDTGGYLLRALEGTLTIGRSALYGAFLASGLSFDFWPNVVIQAAVTVFIVRALLRTHGLGEKPGPALLITLALAAFSSLPWYVSQLMPDILVGWAVLALYLIAVRRDALGRFETLVLGVVIALAIASHMGTLALCLGLIACFGLMRLAGGRIGLPRPQLAAPALAVAVGVLLGPASNFLIARQFVFTPGGTSFVFGRVLQDGLIKRYLDDKCPDATIKLCDYAAELPGTADEWLWTYASPIHKLGGWDGYAPEARRLILATLRVYPAAHLDAAIRAAVEQFASFRTTLSVKRSDNIDAIETFARVLSPRADARFLSARQQRDQPDVSAINLVHVPAAAMSLVLIGFVVASRRADRFGAFTGALGATVLLALVGNAVICGVFSNPNDRYQNRLIWIAVLAAAIAIGNWRRPAAAPARSSQRLAGEHAPDPEIAVR
jgi:hypothetical protein